MSYSAGAFKKDLAELNKMVEKFTASSSSPATKSGGRRRKSRKSHPKKSRSSRKSHRSRKSGRRGGAKRGERRLDAEGNPLRSFRVISINGRDVSGEEDWATRYYFGTRKNNTPGKAADHAFPKLCLHLGKNKGTCKVTFTLKETTKGSVHKDFGPYHGTFKRLVETRLIRRRDPKTGKISEYDVRYKGDVTLAGEKK